MIYERCKDLNIFIETDWIPVIPAQHYLCGGIEVDTNGKTSIENLFACGECSYTGLHGANRLASNSLLEALVYSDKIFNYLKGNSNFTSENKLYSVEIDSKNKQFDTHKKISKLRTNLQNLMQKNVGIVRNNTDLNKTLNALYLLQENVQSIENEPQVSKEMYELKNMLEVSILIIKQSLLRTVNSGSFYKV